MFPPVLRELPPPPLELFDLEEAFSSEKTRLAQITNKCLPEKDEKNYDEESNLTFLIVECARIVRPSMNISEMSNPKRILYDLAVELYQFKKQTLFETQR